MEKQQIQKRCENCEQFFFILNVRQSRIRELLLLYTPCPHCHHGLKVKYPKPRDGNCLDCTLPFALVDYKGLDRCERCYKAYVRSRGRIDEDLLG